MEEENWMPLESNPEVINTFIEKLGVHTQNYQVVDLLSIEDWAQDMIPRPVLGVILLFDQTQPQLNHKQLQKQTLVAQNNSQKLFFMKQYAKNACGTIALFHVILNSVEDYPDLLKENSQLATFRSSVLNKAPEQRGTIFKSNAHLLSEHKEAAGQGQSVCSETTNSHFISFLEKQGNLYELDGYKIMPVNHGPCSKQEILKKTCQVIKKFIDRDPTNLNFNIMVLAQKPGE